MTVVTCVCCSITSDSQTRYGARGCCQGRSWRPCASNHCSTRSAKDFMARMWAGCVQRDVRSPVLRCRRGSVCFAAHRAFDQPGAEQWRYPEVRFELGAEVQTGLCIAALQLPVGLAIAQVAQCWKDRKSTRLNSSH